MSFRRLRQCIKVVWTAVVVTLLLCVFLTSFRTVPSSRGHASNRTKTRSKTSDRYSSLSKPPSHAVAWDAENSQSVAMDTDVSQAVAMDTDSLKINLHSVETTEYGAQLFNVTNAENLELLKHLEPSIPHILHQTWSSNHVPLKFKTWIQSVLDLHPDWEYYFWTDDDVECLLRRRFSAKHLQNFRDYPQGIFRADALRYYILYEYGGVYLDLDHIGLKPLDYWTYTHQAFMSHENYEHCFLRQHLTKPFLINSVMGAKPKHPYFKLLISGLIPAAKQYAKHLRVLPATGPLFVTRILEKMQNSSKLATLGSNAAVSVLHPQYFVPMFDPVHDRYEDQCTEKRMKRLKYIRDICQQLMDRDFENTISKDAFLIHMWTHTNQLQWTDSIDSQRFFNIYDEIPRSRYLSNVLNCDT